jgi:hypothetical protein
VATTPPSSEAIPGSTRRPRAKLLPESTELAGRRVAARGSSTPGGGRARRQARPGDGAFVGDGCAEKAGAGVWRRVKTEQPPFIAHVPGELRRFSTDPGALPPYPCRLCDADFATRASFLNHVKSEHCGWPEYRKRLIYLASSFEGVRPVTPQEYRPVLIKSNMRGAGYGTFFHMSFIGGPDRLLPPYKLFL